MSAAWETRPGAPPGRGAPTGPVRRPSPSRGRGNAARPYGFRERASGPQQRTGAGADAAGSGAGTAPSDRAARQDGAPRTSPAAHGAGTDGPPSTSPGATDVDATDAGAGQPNGAGSPAGDRDEDRAEAGRGTDPPWRPALARSVVLRRDRVRQADLLVLPERVVVLNEGAADIVRLCDGRREVAEIVGELADRFPGAPVADEVPPFLARLRGQGWLR